MVDGAGVEPEADLSADPVPGAVVAFSADSCVEPVSPPSVPLGDELAGSFPRSRDDPGATVARRSFFAQPEPLKWTAGAANAFFTGPLPQTAQLVG